MVAQVSKRENSCGEFEMTIEFSTLISGFPYGVEKNDRLQPYSLRHTVQAGQICWSLESLDAWMYHARLSQTTANLQEQTAHLIDHRAV